MDGHQICLYKCILVYNSLVNKSYFITAINWSKQDKLFIVAVYLTFYMNAAIRGEKTNSFILLHSCCKY